MHSLYQLPSAGPLASGPLGVAAAFARPITANFYYQMPTPTNCLPMNAFGPWKETVPAKIYNFAPLFWVKSWGSDWIASLQSALTKKLMSVGEMEALLKQKPNTLRDVAMVFRWLFYFRQCCDNTAEPFASRVLKHTEIIARGRDHIIKSL